MNIFILLFAGIKKVNLYRELFYIILISLTTALVEVIGISAFSLLMSDFFSSSSLNNNIFDKILNILNLELDYKIKAYIFIIIYLINVITVFASAFLIQKIISLKYHHFKSYLFSKYIRESHSVLSENNAQTLINKINLDPGKFFNKGFGALCIILKNLIIFLFISIYLIIFNLSTVFILIFLLFILGIFLIPRVKNYFKSISILERNYNIENFLSPHNIINSFKEIKIFLAENFFSRKYYESSNLLYKTQLKLHLLQNIPKLFIEICMLVFITIFFVKFYQTSNQEKTFIFFSTVVFAFFRLLPYIIQTAKSFSTIMSAQEYIINFFNQNYPSEKINKKTVLESVNNNYLDYRKKLDVISEIKLSNVSFSFKDKLIFNNLNFIIKKNDKILIYGDLGVGKTILLEILCGFRTNYSGEILINNKELKKEYIDDFKTKIGLVSQNISLLKSSLIENIAFGKTINEINLKKVIKSLNLAGLTEFIDEKKLFNYKINPDFRNISEGQAKRLALARSFYFDKSIIILDETTANLDKSLEKEILQDLLNNKNLTVILVSHDPNLRDLFRNVYKVENKNILKIK